MRFDFFYDFLISLGYEHPVHPILVHITIGLVVASFVFALIAIAPRYSKFAVTARHCATMAAVTVPLTFLAGIMDWQHFYGGAWTGIFQAKLTLGSLLIALLGLGVFLARRLTYRSPGIYAVYLAAFMTVVGLGYYGGELIHSGSAAGGAESEEGSGDGEQAAAGADGEVAYAQIDQIMQSRCVSCHSSGNPIWELDTSSYAGLMDGSKNGPVVEPGNPADSELVKRVKGITQPQMPMGGSPLSEQQVQRIERWIEQGAPGPEDAPSGSGAEQG